MKIPVNFFKVTSLPSEAKANSFYFVENGDQIETYLTDDEGNIKNAGSSEMVLAALGALIEVKGDLLAGSAANTILRLAVGSIGQRLIAAPSEVTGLKWAGPKIYKFLATQSGTDAPVPTIFENTIGNIAWSYSSTGTYRGILAGAFPEGRVWAPGRIINDTTTVRRAYLYRVDNDTVELLTRANTGLSDGQLTNTPLEIEVWPASL